MTDGIMNHLRAFVSEVPSFGANFLVVCLLGGYAGSTPLRAGEPAKGPDAGTGREIRDVCLSAKEYITALEYLRDHPDLKTPDTEAQQIAEKVALGCKGAAQRFIQVTNAVSVAGLVGQNAVKEGVIFATKSDGETRAFLTAFKMGFLEDGLDLDVKGALVLGHSLSTMFNGEHEHVRRDFERIIRFCMTTEGLDLPKPTCGKYSARIARLGEQWEKGVSDSFVNVFSFLTEKNRGPGLTTAEALKLAESITAAGPGSAENFMQAYRYGQAEKGLKLDVQQAVAFAKKLNTYRSPLPGTAARQDRAIASEKK